MLGLANPNHLQNPRPPTREIIKLISIKNTGGFDLEWITLRTSPRTLQNVANLAKFCPPPKTHSQTRSNTSPILLNSVPLSKHTLRHPLIRHQSCQILSPSQDTLSDTQQYVINPVEICLVTQETCIIFHCFSWQTIGRGESGWCSDVTSTHGACCVAARFAQLLRKSS